MTNRLNVKPLFSVGGAILLFWISIHIASAADSQTPSLELRRGDHVVYIGNTMADRMQHHGWLETYLHALHPDHELNFRNLGFAGDEVKTRPRSADFGSPDQWLAKCEADVVFCFFGYNEALRGDGGLEAFKNDLAAMIDSMRSQRLQRIVAAAVGHLFADRARKSVLAPPSRRLRE